MEFLVLPLLLLVGLVTSLDGGSDEDGGNGSGDGNDVLTGSGTEHVYGQTGDDDLTLSDHAVGMGGDGNDTLNAVDEAVGYGLAGNDSLIGADHATIKGGEGDDWLDARDEALASGGNGNDVIFTSGDAEGSGGNGSDTMEALDESRIYGGDGTDYLSGNNQTLVYGGNGYDTLSLDDRAEGYGGAWDDILDAAGQNRLTGGLGSDHFIANLDRSGADGPADLTVTDYDAGEDQLAVLLGQSDTSGLTMTLGRTEDNSGTVIEITDEADALVARFTLEGVTEFDPASLQFYDQGILDVVPFTGTIVPLSPDLDGSGTETVTGGEGDDEITLSDAAVGHGGAGDDTLIAEDNAQAFGDEGNDEIRLADVASGDGGVGDDTLIGDGRTSLFGDDGDDVIAGNGTLEGGAGDDRLDLGYDRDISTDRARNLLYGQADGGDGNDTITAYSGVQEDDRYTTSGSMAIWGGAGDDFIAASGIYAIDAGTGDDTVSVLSDDIGQKQDMKLGAGSDVVLADVAGVLPAFYYGMSAVITDFNPAEDQLAVILEQGTTDPVVTYVWDAVRGGTDVFSDDSVRFFLQGVNHQVTPLSVSFYASEAAFQAGTPYATV